MRLDLRTDLIAFALAFVVYALIAPAGVLWMDPGELAAAGFNLGSSHPPGHPGHAMIARLASLVPIGEVAYRIALLSALSMAIAVVGVLAIATQLVPKQLVGRGVAAGLFALSPAAVLDATRAEVYAPACACIVWSLRFALRFARAGPGEANASDALSAVGLCAAAAWFHPAIAVAAAVPIAVALGVATRGRWLRLAPMALALVVCAAAIYLYLPLRADSVIVWDTPDTAAGFWRTVTGVAYSGNFGVDGVAGRFASRWAVVGEGIALGALFAGLCGLAFGSLTRLRGSGLVLACAAAVVLGAALQHRINPDFRGYVLPAVAMTCIGVVIICEAAIKALPLPDDRNWRHGAAVVVLVPVVGLGWIHGSSDVELDRSDDVLELVDDTVGAMPPGPGLFLATSDHVLFPSRYERFVAGHRPDVALTTPRLAAQYWVLGQIDRDLPELYVPMVDDRVGGRTAARLAVTNLRQGRPVFGDAPWFGILDPMSSQPVRRGYAYLLRAGSTPADQRVPAPPEFSGRVGTRVAGFVGLRRGEYEAQRGRLGDAAYAAGLARRFVDDVDRLFVIPDDSARPPLYPFLPRQQPIFLWDESSRELLGDELAWRAGLPAPDEATGKMRRLHRMWRGLLEGQVQPGPETIGVFGVAEEAATTLMLLALGRPDLAEPHLRSFLSQRGDDADALAILGSLYAGSGRTDEARQVWLRARNIDPSRQDVQKWLSDLE